MISLDLHGIKHENVRRVLIRFIEDHYNQDVTAYIITGNSNQMKNHVIDVLNEYGLDHRFSLKNTEIVVEL